MRSAHTIGGGVAIKKRRSSDRQNLACRSLATAVILCISPLLAASPARATIRYEVSVAQPSTHRFRITMTIPDVHGSVLIQMPAWNGLYQIRDFAYHVIDLRLANGSGAGGPTNANTANSIERDGAQTGAAMPQSRPGAVTRLDKQTWRIAGEGAVRIEYGDYWDEPGPFGTQLNGDHAFINMAMVLCYLPERRAEDVQVKFTDLPATWRVAIELPKANFSPNIPANTNIPRGAADSAADANTFSADSYDALVDAPVELGAFDEFAFQAAGRPIRVVIHGEPQDHARLTQQLTQIVEYETRLMGDSPFKEYLFLYHVGRDYGGGGMEHTNCTAITIPSSNAILNVTAHEFFHLWNVKRIRPQSLEPVDYTREMWTPSLWFAEGFTNSYASYTLVRTGLWSKTQFLADLGDQVTELETRPAHRWQSAEESSRDAWFEKYPLYSEPDFSVSYYNKGQLLGVVLDIILRDATDNRASLDDLLRKLNEQYAQHGRFFADSVGLRAATDEVLRDAHSEAKSAVANFFDEYVAGTSEIPFASWFARAGLLLKERGQKRAAFGFGLLRNPAGAAVISDLDSDSDAARAGLHEGDVLDTLDGADVPRNAVRWLRGHQPGDSVAVRTRRAGVENNVSFALGEEPTHVYVVEEMPQPSEKQLRIRNGLLQGLTSAATPSASANFAKETSGAH
jgi:predicted metalloprotease with PDZ domain